MTWLPIFDRLLARFGWPTFAERAELREQLATAQAFARYVVERTDRHSVVVAADDTVLQNLRLVGGSIYVLPGVKRTLVVGCYCESEPIKNAVQI